MRTIEIPLRDYAVMLITSLSYGTLFIFTLLKSAATDFVITMSFNSYKEAVAEVIITLVLVLTIFNMFVNIRFHRIGKVKK